MSYFTKQAMSEAAIADVAAPVAKELGKKLLPGVKYWGLPAGAAGAAGLDYLQNPESRYPFDMRGFEGSKRWRLGNAAINTGFLTMAPFLTHKPGLMYGALGSPFAKDLMVKGMPTLDSVQKNMDTQRMGTRAGLALGAGALTLGGLGLAKFLRSKGRDAGGRVRVTLPTKSPSDKETEVDMPLDDSTISPAQRERLARDIRKRLRGETRERTLKLDPETHKLIPYDQWKARFGDTKAKAASERLSNIVHLANNLWK